MIHSVRKDLNSAILNRPLSFFNEKGHSTGDLIGTLSEDVKEINTNTLELYLLIINGIVGLICGTIIAYIYSVYIGIAAT